MVTPDIRTVYDGHRYNVYFGNDPTEYTVYPRKGKEDSYVIEYQGKAVETVYTFPEVSDYIRKHLKVKHDNKVQKTAP